MDKFIKYSKFIFNYFFIVVIVIALAVNVSVASINILNSFFSENELIRAGKFLDSVKSKVNKDGYIFYKTNDYDILVMTKEWSEKTSKSE